MLFKKCPFVYLQFPFPFHPLTEGRRKESCQEQRGWLQHIKKQPVGRNLEIKESEKNEQVLFCLHHSLKGRVVKIGGDLNPCKEPGLGARDVGGGDDSADKE